MFLTRATRRCARKKPGPKSTRGVASASSSIHDKAHIGTYRPGVVPGAPQRPGTVPLQFKDVSINSSNIVNFNVSMSKGPQIDLSKENFASFWNKMVHEKGGEEWVVDKEKNLRWSWKDMDRYSNAIARGLRKQGFRRGNTIAVWLPNSFEHLAFQIACYKTGIVIMNISTSYSRRELLYILNISKVSALFLGNLPEIMGIIHQLVPSLSEGKVDSQFVPALKRIFVVSDEPVTGMTRVSDMVDDTDDDISEGNLSLISKDYMAVHFTSSTTGVPKGAIHSHQHLINSAMNAARILNLTTNDVICLAVPTHHVFGSVIGNLASIASGSKLVYPSYSFSAGKTLKSISEEKCTTLYGTPQMFQALLDEEGGNQWDTSSLVKGVISGSNCPPAELSKFRNSFKFTEFTNAYITTETAGIVIKSGEGDEEEARTKTVGLVQPGYEAKIVDRSNHVLSTGIAGELCLRGFSQMREYIGDINRTWGAIDEEGAWFHTSDSAIMDDNGNIKIVGQAADVLYKSGVPTYPHATESALESHPAVQKCLVIGVPDVRFGEDLCAFVLLRPGSSASESDLENFAVKILPHTLVPKYVKICPSLPTSANGKYQKFKLRELWRQAMEEDEVKLY